MSPDAARVAMSLAKHRCFLTGEFKLASGFTSPYYLDLRTVPSHPELYELVADAYVHMLKREGGHIDGIAGLATAGIPLAALAAYKLSKPLVYVRKEERAHGTGRVVEGAVSPGGTFALLDDVATTGESLAKGALALRGLGAKVDRAFVLVDREQGAGQLLASIGVRLIPFLTSSELVRYLYSGGLISADECRRIIDYVRGGGV